MAPFGAQAPFGLVVSGWGPTLRSVRLHRDPHA